MVWTEIAVGFAVSGTLAALSVARRSLTVGGGIAAVVVGTAIFAGGGPAWFTALVVFFATSTLLGRVGAARKAAVKGEFAKSDTRDAWQVVANGGVAAAAAVAFGLAPTPLGAAAFVGALAAANGDTWATELGVLSRRDPWLLVPPRRVPRGTSGAVSPAGLLASLGGAAVIGLVAAAVPDAYAAPSALLLAAGVLGGLVGSLADSVLGATLQAGFFCQACGRPAEAPVHRCGTGAVHVRGVRWLDNDGVNLAATALGAMVGVIVALAA